MASNLINEIGTVDSVLSKETSFNQKGVQLVWMLLDDVDGWMGGLEETC